MSHKCVATQRTPYINNCKVGTTSDFVKISHLLMIILDGNGYLSVIASEFIFVNVSKGMFLAYLNIVSVWHLIYIIRWIEDRTFDRLYRLWLVDEI